MKGARTGLRVFGWIYIIIAILMLGVTVLALTYQDFINEALKNINYDFKEADPKLVIGILFGTMTIIYGLIGIGLKNVANNRSKGTILFVLLIVAVVMGIAGLINSFSVTALSSVIIDFVVLLLLYTVRKENN